MWPTPLPCLGRYVCKALQGRLPPAARHLFIDPHALLLGEQSSVLVAPFGTHGSLQAAINMYLAQGQVRAPGGCGLVAEVGVGSAVLALLKAGQELSCDPDACRLRQRSPLCTLPSSCCACWATSTQREWSMQTSSPTTYLSQSAQPAKVWSVRRQGQIAATHALERPLVDGHITNACLPAGGDENAVPAVGLQLIDFGRSVDQELLPPGTLLCGDSGE